MEHLLKVLNTDVLNHGFQLLSNIFSRFVFFSFTFFLIFLNPGQLSLAVPLVGAVSSVEMWGINIMSNKEMEIGTTRRLRRTLCFFLHWLHEVVKVKGLVSDVAQW